MFMWVSWHWQRLCLLDNIWQPHEEVRWLYYILHFTIFLTKYLDINIAGFTIGMEKRWLLALIKSTVLEKRKCVSKTKRQCRHSKYKKMCQMRMEIWNRCNMFFFIIIFCMDFCTLDISMCHLIPCCFIASLFSICFTCCCYPGHVIASNWLLLLFRWYTPYPVVCGMESWWRMVIETCWLFWWFSDFWYFYEIPTHLIFDK